MKDSQRLQLPEDERETARLALDARHVDTLHGVHVELPDLQRTRQVRVEVHGDEETLDGRRRTAGHLQLSTHARMRTKLMIRLV